MGIKTALRSRAMQVAAVTLAALLPLGAIAGQADSYLQSAHQLERSNDPRGAEIQLRNAAQSEPSNGNIRLELARIYLKLGNPNAAQAELYAAHLRGVREDATAPFMAQAMLELGQLGDLLKNVPAGNRAPKSESLVRTYRGMAEVGLHDETAASAMFADAERLDPRSALPLIGEARLLMEQRQFEHAEAKLDQALKLDPGSSDAMDLKALTLAMRGKIDMAMQQLAAALAADPRNIRALLDRAELEMRLGHLDLAEKDLQAVRKTSPGNAMALFIEGSIDAQRGKYKEADAIFDKFRGAMSAFPLAYLVAADVKLKLNQTGQAESYARKFLAQAGDQPKAYELLGIIALKRGNLESAITSLEKAIRLAPDDEDAIKLLGQAYMAHGDQDKAKAMFDEAALKVPGNDALATQRALADFALGDRDIGLSELNNVFKQGKGNIAAGPPLVLDALQTGRIEDAAAAAQELVSRDPGNTSYEELLALARIRQNNFAAAESLLRGLLAKNPDLASARLDLAQMYVQTHRVAEAKKLYQDRLNASPSDVTSMEALADISFRQMDDVGAFRWLDQAQMHAPTNPQPTLRMISIFEARKKWPDAVGLARALQTKFPNDPSVRDELAHLYFSAGNRAASLGAYQDAVAKFPTNALLLAHYAAVLAANKDYGKAADVALRAVRLDPGSTDIKRVYVSLTYLGRGADAALSASEQVFGSGPTAALVAAGAIESGHNRPAAIATLEKWQSRAPSGAVAAKLAGLYQRNNQTDKALGILEPWAASHPADLDVHLMLALIYGASGKSDGALAQYELLATQRPDNPVILNNLALLYDAKHDPRARATAEKAMKLAPSSGSIADTLGWILVGQGDIADATKYLQLASVRLPADATIQYHYAVALSKIGKPDQARALLHRLLATNASAETLSSARTLLASLGASH